VVDDFIPFEKALEELKMNENELKRLISEDEIQAVRDEDGSIRLKKTDVEALAQSSDEIVEELVFADEDDAGMVTAVLDEDTLLEDDDTLEIAPESLEVEEEPEKAPVVSSSSTVRSRGRAASIRGGRQKDPGEEATWERALAIITAVFLIYGLFVTWSITQGQKTGVTAWLADFFK